MTGSDVPGAPFGLTAEVLAAAMAEPDPGSLGAAARLRARFGAAESAAALTQAALRRQARTKFGDDAHTLFFTRAGLEQATRPELAAYHARRFVEAGARRVVDLGCGIGTDALAFVRAGLDVVAVERDPETAAAAQANLGPAVEVVVADVEDVVHDVITPGTAVFCDPARRTERGRSWRVEDFSPSWTRVAGWLDGRRVAGVKAGPGLPPGFIPETAEVEWITHDGSTVEAALWAGPAAVPGRRSALVWPGHRLVTTDAPPPPVREVGRFLYEPAGAVIRSGGIAALAAILDAGLLDPQVAYLTGDRLVPSAYATVFVVREALAYDVKRLRAWVRSHDVGVLEIKKRGVEVDPAELRRRLAPRGSRTATLVLARTPRGALVLVVERVRQESGR